MNGVNVYNLIVYFLLLYYFEIIIVLVSPPSIHHRPIKFNRIHCSEKSQTFKSNSTRLD